MTTNEELTSFFARVMILCDVIGESCSLTDLQSVRDRAKHLKKESLGLSKVFPRTSGGVCPVGVHGIGGPEEPASPPTYEDLL